MNVDPNPYVPPQTNSEHEVAAENRLQRVLLEATHAFFTILGIVLGWGIIGSGILQNSTVRVVLGCTLIAATCCFGLLMKVNRKRAKAKGRR